MKEELPVKKTESLFEEMERFRYRLMRRAYELFLDRATRFDMDLDDWFNVEKELSWRPAVEMTEKDNAFVLKIAIPGIDARDLDIRITPDDVLVKAEKKEERKKEEEGKIYFSEFTSGQLFRSVHFPRKVNPDKVTAEYKNGVLYITAAIAEAAKQKRLEVKAA